VEVSNAQEDFGAKRFGRGTTMQQKHRRHCFWLS